ncbi:MAG: protein translocase subunit SecD [Polyangiaceae bacterium]|nr:protein translocase subunit SecD [Polyangiaceae bacterium]
MASSRRNGLLLMVLSAALGYLFFRQDNFWAMISFAFVGLCALIYALPVMDNGWRFKTGFSFATLLTTLLILWPTAHQAGWVKCPQYLRDRVGFAIVKGLDLSGGLRLVYTVEVEEAIRDKRNRFADDMRQQFATIYGIHSGDGLLKRDELVKLEEKVHVFTPPGDSATIRVKFKDAADVSKVDDRFSKKFSQEMSQSKGIAADEVLFKIRTDIESQIRERAVNQAKETVNRRVDELGLREASVTTRDEDIIVEVPGEDQKAFDQIKETISRTARLEFKMVDDESDFFGKFKEEKLPEGEMIAIEQERAPAGPDRQVDTHFARIGKKADEKLPQTLERFKKWVATLSVPDDHQVGFEPLVDYNAESGETTELGWRTLYLFNRAEVTGDSITDAMVAQDQRDSVNSSYYVAITFSPAGADRFEEITGANIKRRFAIILDDLIDSAPVIQGKIGGGHASITMGAGDRDEQLKRAKQLELVLRSGALPAPISLSNDTKIGPSLGKDAIQKGIIGMLVGSGLVLLFMALYYRKSGLVSDVAVLFNLLIQLSTLAVLGATMTLPGICALALTIGMGVDANVLINERIREELRAGRSVRAAVESGYEKAFSSIIDGHITVLISAVILAQYGSGPVKGFAVTLIFGIMASLFTGVVCTRLFFDWWVRGAKVKTLSVGAEF